MKDKIDFIGIGCQKCGTTSVFNALAMHPLIHPPKAGFENIKTGAKNVVHKECHYWGNLVRSLSVEQYHDKFFGTLYDRYTYGEFTPNYILFEEALRRIRDYNPDIKLLAVFRNPVERLWSEYKMFRGKKRYKLSFRDLIDKYSDLQEPRILSPMKPEIWPIYRSCYGRQAKKVLKLFDRKNLFFIRVEELQDFSATIDELFKFLGLAPIPVPELKLNTSETPKEKIPYHEELLDRFFLRDIELLESLLGWDCETWKRCL